MKRETAAQPLWLARPKSALFIFLLLVSISAPCRAGASEADRRFVNKASVENEFEIEASRLALQQSRNDSIKAFAQKMVDDDTQIADYLKSILSYTNADIPVPDNKLDSPHQKMLDKLNGASGRNFDRLYIRTQIRANEKVLSAFMQYAAHGQNAALRDFTVKTIPVVKLHKKEIPTIK